MASDSLIRRIWKHICLYNFEDVLHTEVYKKLVRVTTLAMLSDKHLPQNDLLPMGEFTVVNFTHHHLLAGNKLDG